MKIKSRLHSNKLGYLQIDFAFVVLIFFLFFYFIYTEQDTMNNSFKNIGDINLLIADSKDICFLLTKTSGYPDNWETNISNLNFVGLKNISSNNLDINKISALTTENYFLILDSLNISSYIVIDIKGLSSQTDYLNLGNSTYTNLVSSYSCFSNYNNEQVKVNVEVWQ